MMRFIYLFTFCCGFLIGCNINYPADSNATLQGRITKKQVMRYLPGVHLGQAQLLENSAENKESFRIKNGLITHERFLVLEQIDAKEIHLNNHKKVMLDSSFTNKSVNIYEAGPSSLAIRYEAFKGRTVRVNQANRIQVVSKISKLVIVDDVDEIYLAGLLDKPAEPFQEYSWATTNKRLNAQPFIETEDEALSQLALTHFDSLTEYQLIKENPLNYGHTQAYTYEFRKDEKYVVVQYYSFGACNSLEANYMALYHVTPGSWVREAEGRTGFLFRDLIDVDGDLYPEFLMNDISETAIFEINYRGFNEVTSVRWSYAEWPC